MSSEASPVKGKRGNSTRWNTVLCVLWVGALAIRLIYLAELARTPVFDLLLGDARGYDLWARNIAAGEWVGKGVFYQAPLYPYLLGGLYAAVGPSLWGVRLVQAALGATSCVLLARSGACFFGRRSGLVAGVLLAVWPTAVFSDGLIQKSSLDLFLTCALLSTSGATIRGRARSPWLLLGLILGGLALTRENSLVLLPVFVLWLLWKSRSIPLREKVVRAALFGAGFLALLAPVAIRNYAVGGAFHLTTAQFGPNFYIGNNPSASGTYSPLRPGRGDSSYEAFDARDLAEREVGRRLDAGEVSAFWTGEALRFIREQPLSWLGLMARKFLLTWNRAEVGDTEDQRVYGEWSRLLGVLNPLLHLGGLLPSAAAGVALTWRLRRRLWVLYAFLAAYSSSVAVFYVFARYRFPLVPVLVLFAAAASTRLFRVRRPSALAAALVVSLAGAVVANLPLASVSEPLARSLVFHNVGLGLCIQGQRYAQALPYFERSLELNEGFADAHYGIAIPLRKLGRLPEALAHLNRALALQPWWAEAMEARAIIHFDQGRWGDADRDFRAALGLNPLLATSHYGLGQALLRMGEPDTAAPHLAEAARLDARYR